MNTEYAIGDVVASTVDAQGMDKDAIYCVVDVLTKPSFLGTFVTYVLEGEVGERLVIGNGHLVLRKAEKGEVRIDECPYWKREWQMQREFDGGELDADNDSDPCGCCGVCVEHEHWLGSFCDDMVAA